MYWVETESQNFGETLNFWKSSVYHFNNFHSRVNAWANVPYFSAGFPRGLLKNLKYISHLECIFYALRKLLPYIFNALMGSMVNSHLPFEPSKERSFGHELIWYTRATHVLQRQLLQRTMKLDSGSSAGPCLDTMDWQALSPHAWSLLILETNETDKWAKKTCTAFQRKLHGAYLFPRDRKC